MDKKYYIYKVTSRIKEKECSYEEAFQKAENNRKLINLIDKLRK